MNNGDPKVPKDRPTKIEMQTFVLVAGMLIAFALLCITSIIVTWIVWG